MRPYVERPDCFTHLAERDWLDLCVRTFHLAAISGRLKPGARVIGIGLNHHVGKELTVVRAGTHRFNDKTLEPVYFLRPVDADPNASTKWPRRRCEVAPVGALTDADQRCLAQARAAIAAWDKDCAAEGHRQWLASRQQERETTASDDAAWTTATPVLDHVWVRDAWYSEMTDDGERLNSKEVTMTFLLEGPTYEHCGKTYRRRHRVEASRGFTFYGNPKTEVSISGLGARSVAENLAYLRLVQHAAEQIQAITLPVAEQLAASFQAARRQQEVGA